jgi:hypothetical protein
MADHRTKRPSVKGALPKPAPDPGKPLGPPAAPPASEWLRSIATDHNGDFDLGAILVGVVAVFMCLNSGYDTIILHKTFDAQAFGIGIGAMLGGFAAYKYGDAKRPTAAATAPRDG